MDRGMTCDGDVLLTAGAGREGAYLREIVFLHWVRKRAAKPRKRYETEERREAKQRREREERWKISREAGGARESERGKGGGKRKETNWWGQPDIYTPPAGARR
jgi:hypothetical protein